MAVFKIIFSYAAQALLFLLVLLVIAFIGYCMYIQYMHMKYDHIPGPPRDSFLLGHTASILKVMKDGGVVHDKFLEWAETYGSVTRVNALHIVYVIVTCPETTKTVLMSPKYPKDSTVYKRLFNLFGVRFLGNGLVTAQDHEQWYKQRRIMDPAFSSLYLRGLMGTFNEMAEKLMVKLEDLADKKKDAGMLHLINCVTMDVIGKVAFGEELDLLNNTSPFPEAVELCLKGMTYYLRDVFFPFIPKNWKFVNDVKTACQLLRTTGAKWINRRKVAIRNGDEVPKDILTQIIKTASKEENMTQEDEEFMLDNFVTFFIAGQETTANQLGFCVMELTRRPDIVEKLRKEVDEVLGMKKEISYDDLGQLVYVSQVLKETLRIYPPAPGTSREVDDDFVIDGIRVPGGTKFLTIDTDYQRSSQTFLSGRLDLREMAIFKIILSYASQALLFLLVLLVIAFIGYCMYIQYIHMKYDHIPGPPRDSFFLGNSASILKVMKDGGIVHDKFLEWAETYGPVYRICMLHVVYIFVTCPETTKEVLMSPKYPKDKFVYERLSRLFGVRFLGNGLVTARDHEQWYKQRRIMDPAFSSLYLRGLMGTFNDMAEKLMVKLEDLADKKKDAGMLHLINCVTMDVIGKVAFGEELDLLNNRSPFPEAVELCLKGLTFYLRDVFFQFIPKNWKFVNDVKTACQLLRTTGAKWIHRRKVAIQNGDEVPKDILTQIIKTASKEENMTQEDEEFMLDNFVTFFIAGQETTANQLGFCVMELTRRPDIVDKLRKEVDEVLGMKKEISYDDLGQLVYVSQVLKETLRLYPPAPGTSRDVRQDFVIDGIPVPGGATFMFESYVTGRMEKFFKDPLKFDPDRFHPDAPKPYFSYYPFSLGPRSCLGLNFAQMEAKVVLAKLIQRFDFTLSPGQNYDIIDSGTLRPKTGVMCSVRHRNHKK
ncbi:uncharacterized protein V6R79_014859 [Siganus canaliculatus]